jgi:hypothetical protein
VIIYKVQPSGREVMAEILKESARGELYVQPEAEPARWIPKSWVTERDGELQ